MAVSATDKKKLSSEQQAAVQSYTDQYNAAKAKGDTEAMNAAHAAAESVRNQAGYSGGGNGSGNTSVSSAQTAQQVQNYLNQYRADNAGNTYEFGGKQYWSNNYSAQDNLRSQANTIRQQMLQNSQNWHNATTQEEKDYLHEQNVALNNLLNQYAGGVESRYDPTTGKWYTANADLGYGDIESYDRTNAKKLYGVSDADLDRYLTNTERYFNFEQQNAGRYAGRSTTGSTLNGMLNGVYGQSGAQTGYAQSGLSGSSGAAGASSFYETLEDWRTAAQAEDRVDYATQQAILALQRAQEDAAVGYQTQRDQIAAAQRNSMDNAALYAELRGDRGGIGLAQYNSVQNTAEEKRLAVDAAQLKLATDTERQINDLRAQGELTKAEQVLEISQEYMQQLMAMEQWAAEYGLSAAKFEQSVREWENEFALSVGQVTGSYAGQTTLTAQKYSDAILAESGEALLAAGMMPNSEQLAAMGLAREQAEVLLGK